MTDDLSLWTIYESPSDAPGLFVARLFIGERATTTAYHARTLDAIRALLPPGLYRIPRDPRDPAQIIETWL